MFIIQLIGGLGNQMFQYAAGRRLAHHHNTSLFLDVSLFSAYKLRKYELDIFNIEAAIAPPDMLKQVAFSSKDIIYLRLRNVFLPNIIIRYIREKSYEFDEYIYNAPDNYYIEGYFQSERYFADISNVIRKNFTFKNEPNEENKRILSRIQNTNSVSLHIRRGDYISNPKTMETHGVLGIDYYLKGLNYIEKNIRTPEIFIFSDDIAWAKENILIKMPIHFIDHNQSSRDYEDLRLMSCCKHNIIANSSFSWWGAWLNQNPDKIVIAPQKWFNDPTINTNDLIPSTWIRL